MFGAVRGFPLHRWRPSAVLVALTAASVRCFASDPDTLGSKTVARAWCATQGSVFRDAEGVAHHDAPCAWNLKAPRSEGLVVYQIRRLSGRSNGHLIRVAS